MKMCCTELIYIFSGKLNNWSPVKHLILEIEGKAPMQKSSVMIYAYYSTCYLVYGQV
jgi:hypothetical protein